MKNIGWDVSGIEINPGARQYSKDVFSLNVYDSSFLKTNPGSSFDCITLWHVLEHFHFPGAYLMEIKKVLKPCGKVIIALPNAGSADAIFYKNNWAAWDVPRHLWHFTPDTFGKFASKHGFRIKLVKGLPLDVFYISVLSEKHKGSSGAIFKGMTKGLIFTISSLFDSARKSSLIYVLEADESISVEPAIPS
jgi:predicted SAM-dependent methyltransferase